MRRFALILLAVLAATPAFAARFVSLKADRVFLREGPTYKHRVLFIYTRKFYPLELLASYQGWRRVRDFDGTVGWISQTMLSDVRTALVTGKKPAALHVQPYAASPQNAWLEPGVVAKLKACKPHFCEVTAGGLTGWLDRSRIWGVSAGEIFD